MDRLKAVPKIVELILAARQAPNSLSSLIEALRMTDPQAVELLTQHQGEFRALLSSVGPLVPTPATDAAAPASDALGGSPEAASSPEQGADEAAQVCPVCLEAMGGGGSTTSNAATKEIVTLACGHQIHLSCWLPCVLPIGGGGTAQERHVEDRMGRKCGVCRGEFSQATQRGTIRASNQIGCVLRGAPRAERAPCCYIEVTCVIPYTPADATRV